METALGVGGLAQPLVIVLSKQEVRRWQTESKQTG